MSTTTLGLSDAIREYLLQVSVREADVLQALREETSKLDMAVMQISPEQGQFMHLLVNILGARRCIEVGVFTGYSSICVATALPDHGQIIACDINKEWTGIAQRYWQQAGVEQKIDLHIAPALQTLDDLIAQGETGSFDFAFIDADKTNYLHYYERCLRLMRVGGVIAVDNVLWSGSVIDMQIQDEDTQAIREFNQFVHNDKRIELSMLPIGDGLTLIRKLA